MVTLNFFNIVAEVLQRDTLVTYLFLICLHFVRRTSIDLIKENGFTLKKTRNRQYHSETMTDADYLNDIAFLAITPAQT